MYSLIFFRETCHFLHSQPSYLKMQSSLLQSHVEHQKHFVWLTKSSVARFVLFLCIIKKGGQCWYIRPWMNRGAWQLLYTNRKWEERGVKETPVWWRMYSSPCSVVPSGQMSKFPVWSTNPRMPCDWVIPLIVKQVRVRAKVRMWGDGGGGLHWWPAFSKSFSRWTS